MRNYVIINGVNSNTINGLGINELPPITKPQMRVQSEEIDGRDGDIITNLGYSAYDKTITIGLFGTGYDINNIVAFFNGEGTIVFSNEADKYYNFKILNQIDYVALQKFKSASITFHCQPFKYPLTETPLEIEYTYIEDEGESLTLNNTGEATMKLDLKGNTSQTGTPTPDTPLAIHTITGDNEVVVCGKNLLNPNATSITKTGITLTNNGDGTYTANGTSTSANDFPLSNLLETPIVLEANTEYTQTLEILSGTFGGSIVPAFKDSNGTTTYNYFNCTANSRVHTKTTTDKMTAYTYNLYVGNNVTISNCTFRVQLEKGTSTPYEPYQSQTYEVDLGTLELCKIGDYQDYFTKNSSGQWCKYNAIGKVVLDGSEEWNKTGNVYRMKISTAMELSPLLCNRYKYTEHAYNDYECNTATTYYNINFRNSTISSVENWKTEIATNNLILCFVLATPYLSPVEDETLKSQLDNIENAMSYEGTTNIGQVNNDKPFIISVKAVEDGTNEVVVNNIGNVYSKPLIALEGSGNVDIYLDNTQILQANVEDKMNIDIAKLEAYNPDTSALLNRKVIGNYNTMTLQPGESTIRIDGALDKATISNYTRWI